jgi:hypothetical protein
MSKTFTQAPKPKPLSAEVISAFERGGTGQDTQTHISSNGGSREPTKAAGNNEEPTKRLSIDLPISLHRRFKTACAKADKIMNDEVADFIQRRAAELEQG